MSKSNIEKNVINTILQTKNHDSYTKIDSLFNKMDLSIISSDFDSLIKWENGISKEYSFVPFKIYKKHRLAFLNNYSNKPNILKLISYLENKSGKNFTILYVIKNTFKYLTNYFFKSLK